MSDDSPKRSLMIVAGEPSGDAHAAKLVEALRKFAGTNLEIFGAAGPLMRGQGVEAITKTDDLAIIGLIEVGRTLRRFWSVFKTLKRAAVKRCPEAVILVDWPEFNLKLARSLHRSGIRVIYYISPQLWAWRPYRLRGIRRNVDLLLSILPFEPSWYRSRGFDRVKFIGNPLAGEVVPRFGREEFCRRHNLDNLNPIVALLPGSRKKEVERILPPMLDAAIRVSAATPDVQFVITAAPGRSVEEIQAILERARPQGIQQPYKVSIVKNETREALAAADAAAVASGTATLEAAIIGTPLVIVYKESTVNWNTLGKLITAEHYGLINLIAGERLVKELMQDEFSGGSLAAEILHLLEREYSAELHSRLEAAVATLGGPGASQRAAEAVLAALNEWGDKEALFENSRGA